MPYTFKQIIARSLDGKGKYGDVTVKFIIALVIFSTASFALSTVESLADAHEAIFSLVEAISIGLFTVEYFLRCWVADDMFAYMMTPLALIDLCSVLPSWLDALIPGDQFPAFNFLRMLRIFKVRAL
jgi:voltage-gated potassium channel